MEILESSLETTLCPVLPQILVFCYQSHTKSDSCFLPHHQQLGAAASGRGLHVESVRVRLWLAWGGRAVWRTLRAPIAVLCVWLGF